MKERNFERTGTDSRGFAVRMKEDLAKALSRHPWVKVVEENAIGHLSSVTQATDADTWHLDRIDGSVLDQSYRYCSDQEVNATTIVYVFDTGIRRGHDEFEWENTPQSSVSCTYFTPPCPRVSTNGYDMVEYDYTTWNGSQWIHNNDGTDYRATDIDDGCFAGVHGTAVSSIIAGMNVGVAQAAYIWPVRVGNCSGWLNLADVLSGIDTVLDERTGNSPGVANFSLYFDSLSSIEITSLEDAIDALIADGIVVVAAANNHDTDNCSSQYPAGFSQVITVGGTNSDDARVTGISSSTDPGSNYGNCVDVFAPGYAMKTATETGDSTYEVRTNAAATSYAAAVVSGIAARYLAEYPTASVSSVTNYILNTATNAVDLQCPPSTPSCTNTTTLLVGVEAECD